MITTTTDHMPTITHRRPLGLIDPTTYRTSLHLVASLVIGTVTFSVIVTLLVLSGSLLITLAGIPLLLGTLLVARGIGVFERKRAGVLLGRRAAAPPHRGGRIRDRLRDPADWRAALYAILLFPVGLVTGTVTLAGWATAAAAITSPFYADRIPSIRYLAGINLEGPVGTAGSILAGIVLLLLMPAIVSTMARLESGLARLLLARAGSK
jgi:hypothetical protein